MKQSVKLILLAVLFCAYCTQAQDEEAADPGSDEIFGNGTNPADNHRAGRMIKGSLASIAAYPYVVTVILTDSTGAPSYSAGVIISSTRVLTAASTFMYTPAGSKITIRAGSNYQTKEGTVFEIQSFVTHSQFNPSNYANNVAIITINGTFDGVPNVQPIAVATTPLDPSSPNLPSCFLLGWGMTESYATSVNLKQAEYKLITDAACASTYKNLVASTQCAQSVTGFGCSGDGGSPLVCDNRLYGTFIFDSCVLIDDQAVNKFTKLPAASIQSFLSANLPVMSSPATQPRKNYVSCP
ncbi:trypsin delta-like [Anopheles darlingi]|uniref:trypsin delta-like n=1 Tax=Anopheles darlingi TaxID=43151 RepID=UPI0021005639|nr:trypsin delta-like [Anopheles darlingi]